MFTRLRDVATGRDLGQSDVDVEQVGRALGHGADAPHDLGGDVGVTHRVRRYFDALLQRDGLRDAPNLGSRGANTIDSFDAGHSDVECQV